MFIVFRVMFLFLFISRAFIPIPDQIDAMRMQQHATQREQHKQRYEYTKKSTHTLINYKVSTRTLKGYAPHYGVGVMERVSKKRNMPIVNCMVSSPYEIIGTWLEVKSLIDDDTLVCRVTDVSAPKDRARHIKKHWAVELDFNSAKTLCNISRVGELPARKCPVEVRRIESFA